MLGVALSMSYQKRIWIFWLLPREMRNRFSLIHCMHIGHLIAQGRSYCNYCFIDEKQCRGINRLDLQEEQICFSLWSVIQHTHLGHIYPITMELRLGVLLLPDISEAKHYMRKKRKYETVLTISCRSALITNQALTCLREYSFHPFLLYILYKGR